MAKYQFAGVVVEMEPLYSRTKKQAIPYLVDSSTPANFKLELNNDLILQKQKEYPNLTLDDIEYIFLGQKFYRYILRHNGILLHSSAVVKDHQAYLFSAPSGTGKSTHTSLWLEYFKDAYILNDDKPAILLIDNKLYAAGTPFSGKCDLSRNEIVPLQGICFIERSDTNWIKPISKKQAIFEILNQTERIPYEQDMELILNLVAKIVDHTNIYKMGCNISYDAVKTSYNTMKMPNAKAID